MLKVVNCVTQSEGMALGDHKVEDERECTEKVQFIRLLRRRVFGLQVLDPRTTVADPSKFEVVPWLCELAFTVMKCKVFNTDL